MQTKGMTIEQRARWIADAGAGAPFSFRWHQRRDRALVALQDQAEIARQELLAQARERKAARLENVGQAAAD